MTVTMRYFDLHCDTVTNLCGAELSDNRRLHISLDRAPDIYIQCWAIFIPDGLRGGEAAEYYRRHRDIYLEQTEKHGVVRVTDCASLRRAEQTGRGDILTVESGAVLGGKLSAIEELARDGVRMMTLTWNGGNELGFGSGEPDAPGLTDFGKAAVREMENCGITVDVSHLSDNGFEDVCELAQKPFVASHSNSRAVYSHKRNLTDRQVSAIAERGGLIGMNLYSDFLASDGASQSDVAAHIRRIEALGASDCIAFGADFDGISRMPRGMTGIESIGTLANSLAAAGLSDADGERYFFGNAYKFFSNLWRNGK